MSNILWRIDLQTTPEVVDAFEMVLEPICDVVSQYLDDDEKTQGIEAYAQEKPDLDHLKAVLSEVAKNMGCACPDILLEEIEQKDWLAEYARTYPPLHIGRYFIYGSHYDGMLPHSKIALKVNAATAFGTGEHASTHGCLLALDQLAKRYDFKRPLDMGCGSSILAMAIAKTWGCPVIASDIDPESVSVSNYNAAENNIASSIHAVCSDGYRSPTVYRNGPYDLIMANILARPLRSMAKDLSRNLSSGGFAVLAGFLKGDANWVFASHRCHGLKLVSRIHVNGWQTLILRKK